MAASGANKKAAAAAQRFLVRQAWGPRRGRFAVQRTLEHLKKGNVVFNETVKAIKLNIPGTHDHIARGLFGFVCVHVTCSTQCSSSSYVECTLHQSQYFPNSLMWAFSLFRRFLYENVPQLKFKNPHVMITRTKDASREANIQVVFGESELVMWYNSSTIMADKTEPIRIQQNDPTWKRCKKFQN